MPSMRQDCFSIGRRWKSHEKILSRHLGFFWLSKLRLHSHDDRQWLARIGVEARSRALARLETRLETADHVAAQCLNKVSEHRSYESRKGRSIAVLTKFAVSCSRSADESADALDRSVRDRGPDPRAHAAAGPVEAGRADHAAHHPLYRRRRDGEPAGPAAGRVSSRRSTASSSTSSARSTASACARHCGRWSGRSASWRARSRTRTSSCSPPFPASARRPPSESSPSCAARSASSP